jgi:hypothetical protein
MLVLVNLGHLRLWSVLFLCGHYWRMFLCEVLLKEQARGKRGHLYVCSVPDVCTVMSTAWRNLVAL